MPRGIMRKVDMEARVMKLKNELYNGDHHDKNGDWHDGAHSMLNRVLDIINEYGQGVASALSSRQRTKTF